MEVAHSLRRSLLVEWQQAALWGLLPGLAANWHLKSQNSAETAAFPEDSLAVGPPFQEEMAAASLAAASLGLGVSSVAASFPDTSFLAFPVAASRTAFEGPCRASWQAS